MRAGLKVQGPPLVIACGTPNIYTAYILKLPYLQMKPFQVVLSGTP